MSDKKNIGPRTYAIKPNPVVPAKEVVKVAKSTSPPRGMKLGSGNIVELLCSVGIIS